MMMNRVGTISLLCLLFISALLTSCALSRREASANRIYLTQVPWELDSVVVNGKYFLRGIDFDETALTDSISRFILNKAKVIVDFRSDSLLLSTSLSDSLNLTCAYRVLNSKILTILPDSKNAFEISGLSDEQLVLNTIIEGKKLKLFFRPAVAKYFDPKLLVTPK